METAEIRKKTKEELEKELKELKEKQGDILFKLAANKLKNVREIRNIKKNIARIMTILKEKNKIIKI